MKMIIKTMIILAPAITMKMIIKTMIILAPAIIIISVPMMDTKLRTAMIMIMIPAKIPVRKISWKRLRLFKKLEKFLFILF